QWIKQYQPLARHKGLRLRSDLPKSDFTAAVDIQKLHIIFNNLLSNAVKYCRRNDQISISLRELPGEFELCVSDNGPGIPYEEQGQIFNWYYQGGESSAEKGTGIGLALTKRLVEDHQGTIHLVSHPGNGCSFSIKIPLQGSKAYGPVLKALETTNEWPPASEGSPAQTKVNFDLEGNREVVLLIDDNSQILEYMDTLLSEDYDLIFAMNGRQGLEKAMQYIPDLIISDIMMPEKNGIELCSILK